VSFALGRAILPRSEGPRAALAMLWPGLILLAAVLNQAEVPPSLQCGQCRVRGQSVGSVGMTGAECGGRASDRSG